MPESVTDRPTKAHEYIFLLSKGQRYCYDHKAIKEKAVYDGENNGVGFGHGTDAKERNRKRIKACSFARKVNESPVPGLPAQHRENREDIFYTGTRNKRTVWTVPTTRIKAAHSATFPPKLIEPCILAGCPEGGTVLDPFGGAGTTSMMSKKLGRGSIYIDINTEYLKMAIDRCEFGPTLFEQHSYEVIS